MAKLLVKRNTQVKGARYYSRQGWRIIAGRRIYFRSGWEVNYAWWLQFLKEKKAIREWEYETTTFWFNGIKRGINSYKPDFKVIREDFTHYWVEVKGYMDSRSLTKIKRFRKYFPDETLQVIDGSWFKEQRERHPWLLERWENAYGEPSA